MSRRNLILLIIILVIVVIAVFGFLFFRDSPATPGSGSPGTNFVSQFNPFGNSGATTPPSPAPAPVIITENPPAPIGEIPRTKLTKVSGMPIAGFAVFLKERLKDMPIITPAAPPSLPYNFGTPTIKSGSTGEAVKEIQRFLNDTRNLSLEQSGILDSGTNDAIKQWQSDNGLVADGIIGPKTKALMYASVNQKTDALIPAAPLTEFMPALRYVDKITGNIYQTFADKIDERKFSGPTIPKVYEAFFGNRGESVIMRYLKADDRTIETFVGNLPRELIGGDTTENNQVKGSFLPNNVQDISISPDTSKIFYLFTSGENMIGTTLSFSDNKKVQVFDSPFTEWLSGWGSANLITLSTKPSAGVPGFMYTLNLTNKNLTETLGDIAALTTLASPDGKLVLFANNNLSLSIYHADTRNSDVLGIGTLPEKCVWGRGSDVIYCAVPKFTAPGAYPDSWYQGEVSFSDQFWKIDLETGNSTLLLDPLGITGGEDVDGIKLAVDEAENYLFFVNKKDSYLWKLDLK